MAHTKKTLFQSNLFGNELLQQLDPADPLLKLAAVLPWQYFEHEFAQYYVKGLGAPSKPIRLKSL